MISGAVTASAEASTTEVRQDFFNWIESESALSLTPIEARIMRAFGKRTGHWTHVTDIALEVYGDMDAELLAYDRNTLRNHISRIRSKLACTSWRIENRYRHGHYRLVKGEQRS